MKQQPETSITKAYQWFLSSTLNDRKIESVCETRDVFTARLQSLSRLLGKKGLSPGNVGFFSAVIGEIGNNCFDHNVGRWPGRVGAYLDSGQINGSYWCVVADKGVGVLHSLKRVLPDLKNDQQSLDKAFHERVTGRAPEKRGNGLKFVRESINATPGSALLFQSGSGVVFFGDQVDRLQAQLKLIKKSGIHGTFALILWPRK